MIMKMTLVFATANEHKLTELRDILKDYDIKGLNDVAIYDEIVEDGSTLEENAYIKAKYLFDHTGLPALSEDTGLEVISLNYAPGVLTARYAGAQKNPDDNIDKLLNELVDSDNRKAQFRTIICYIDKHGVQYFEGVVKGIIAKERKGIAGFGYDPVFIPDGYCKTFAELPSNIKNEISHRARAVERLLEYFK